MLWEICFLTFSFCQFCSAFFQKRMMINWKSVSHPLTYPGTRFFVLEQPGLTFCNWQTQSKVGKVKTSLVTFGCWWGSCSNVRLLIQLKWTQGQKKRLYRARMAWGKVRETQGQIGLIPLLLIRADLWKAVYGSWPFQGPPFGCVCGGVAFYFPPSDQTSKATQGVAVILSFITGSFALICEGTPDVPLPSPLQTPLNQTHTYPHFLSARRAKCCVIAV